MRFLGWGRKRSDGMGWDGDGDVMLQELEIIDICPKCYDRNHFTPSLYISNIVDLI